MHCYVPLCTTFKDPCCSAPVLGTKVVNVFDLKFSTQRWLFCRQKIVLLILHSSSCWDSCTQSIVYNSYQKFASQISIFHENKLIKFNLNVCKSVLCLNQWFMSRIDTGLFLPYNPGQCLLFLGILKGQESKIWAFLALTISFWGPQKQENKNNHNSTIFGAKNKVKSNFIWEKLMEFLLFNEVLKNLTSSNYWSQKLAL